MYVSYGASFSVILDSVHNIAEEGHEVEFFWTELTKRPGKQCRLDRGNERQSLRSRLNVRRAPGDLASRYMFHGGNTRLASVFWAISKSWSCDTRYTRRHDGTDTLRVRPYYRALGGYVGVGRWCSFSGMIRKDQHTCQTLRCACQVLPGTDAG